MRVARYTSKPIGFRRNGSPIFPIAGGNGATGGAAAGGAGDGAGAGDGSTAGSDDGGANGGTAGAGAGDGAGGAGSGDGDKGFPDNTPIEAMTDAQQAAYWKHHARKHENTVKARADYDQIKAKAAEYDEFKRQQMSDHERAVEDAKKAGRDEALREAGTRMVAAHIDAAVTAERISREQADVLLSVTDTTKFLTADHSVDTDKVKALLDTVAPPSATDGPPRVPDFGQGRRDGKVKPSVAAGADLYDSLRGKAKASA